MHAARKHDRRLATALLAAALAHTPEAADVLNGARARLARKPSAIARELLRNFPKGRRRRGGRRRGRKQGGGGEPNGKPQKVKAPKSADAPEPETDDPETDEAETDDEPQEDKESEAA